MAHHLGMNSIKEIVYHRLQVRLKEGPKVIEDNIFLDIKNAMPYRHYEKSQFESKSRPHIEKLDSIVTVIFQMIILVTIFLMFFSLSTTMSSNIYEQAKEIGALRAVGLTKYGLIRLYIYESYILVVASSILGVFIGVGIGWTMTL